MALTDADADLSAAWASIRNHAGYRGLFTRHQAAGAYANGSRVEKVLADSGDTHQVGALATVLGSIHHPELGFGYFVEWDSHPRHAGFVEGRKIGPISTKNPALP
jgi:hypothetical protein